MIVIVLIPDGFQYVLLAFFKIVLMFGVLVVLNAENW